MAVYITKDVSYVGVKDYNRRIFDALIPLPKGTSYNSYLIKAEKSVLVDTVCPGFEEVWLKNISEIISPEGVTYLVMNHAESDHASSIPYFMEVNKNAVLITSEKGEKMAKRFYNISENRILVVKDSQEISLGG